MNYRKFGRTDLMVSEVGFGAWAIGGSAKVGDIPIGWSNTNDRDSKDALLAAVHAGVNFFDTADFYGLGHSEELIGKVIGSMNDIIIATKVGHKKIGDKFVFDYSYHYIKDACEKSLKRLKREEIDYYQLHTARMEHLNDGGCIQAMEELKEEGKIRYWGLSLNTFHPTPEAEFLIENNYGDGFQLVFNLINQRAMYVMKSAAIAGFGVIARMPLQFGLLTGKFNSKSKFDSGDHRSFRLTVELIEKSTKILNEKVWSTANELKISKATLALSYILSHPEVSTVIPGIRTPEQVKQNTIDLKQLNRKQLEYLDNLKADWKEVMGLMEKLG